MKRTAGCLLLALLGASAGWAQGELAERGQKVIDYLLADWQKHMHSTGVEQAMLNLEMEPDDDLRLRIGEHLRSHTDLHFNLRSWGPNNYLLSDEEKRIAKFLIQRFQADGALPTVEAASTEFGIEPDRLLRRLAFLSRAGFLEESDESPGYSLTDRYLRWGGPLRFNYHTISIGEEDPFAVW